MDGFLQMVSCTSEIIIPWYKNNLVMHIEREEWLNQILNSDVLKHSKLGMILFFYCSQKSLDLYYIREYKEFD